MTLQEFRQKSLVDRNISGLQGGEFLRVIIHQDHVMAEFGKTSAGH